MPALCLQAQFLMRVPSLIPASCLHDDWISAPHAIYGALGTPRSGLFRARYDDSPPYDSPAKTLASLTAELKILQTEQDQMMALAVYVGMSKEETARHDERRKAHQQNMCSAFRSGRGLRPNPPKVRLARLHNAARTAAVASRSLTFKSLARIRDDLCPRYCRTFAMPIFLIARITNRVLPSMGIVSRQARSAF